MKKNSPVVFMFSALTKKFFFTLTVFLLVFSSGSIVQADDTEVYFSNSNSAAGSPVNVLFILDTSTSMNGATDDGQTSRATAMKKAARNIIENVENINIGLMRFNDIGGSVIFPITNIDEDTSNVVGEVPRFFVAPIINGLNDGEILIIPLDNRTDGTRISGFRFENIQIPQGATITEASLFFTPKQTNDTPITWNITAEASDDSAEFSETAGDFTPKNRPRTQAVNWDISADAWVEDRLVESASIIAPLQEVVNRSGWCGGNSLSFFINSSDSEEKYHIFKSFEDSSADLRNRGDRSADAVKLKYSYTTSSSGCFQKNAISTISAGSDDAEQSGSATLSYSQPSDNFVRLSQYILNIGLAGDTYLCIPDSEDCAARNQTVGLRFQDVDIPKGATITEAKIQFHARSTSTGAASFTIKGIDEDNLASFTSAANHITNKNKTTAAVPWVPEDWVSGNSYSYETADISTVAQEIVDRTGWASGNSMGFIIEPGSGERITTSYESNPNLAPRLHLRYFAPPPTLFKSVRERVLEIIDDISIENGTPIQRTVHEAARYWRGENMKYGDGKGAPTNQSRVSHPGTYCTAPGACRGAKVNDNGRYPTDAFGVYTPPSCFVSVNPDDDSCIPMEIIFENPSSKATYISPFSSDLSCINNFQVLLTDGAANQGDQSNNEIHRVIGKPTCYTDNSSFKTADDDTLEYTKDEDCVVDLVEALATEDQSSNIADDQIVKTYTIGFNLQDEAHPIQFLKDVANIGQGKYFEANTANELISVFTTILDEIKSEPVPFAPPSLAINAFNRLLSRNEVYFGLFTPELGTSWLGNVKKYNICINSDDNCTLGEILDRNNISAIDPVNAQFKNTAQSIWSSVADGKETTQGGAGAEITDFTQQILYTDRNASGQAASGSALDETGFKLTSSSWKAASLSALRNGICPTPSTANNSECDDRMQWLLGKKIVTDEENDVNANQRWSVSDVLHSTPTIITYGGSDTDADGQIDLFFDKLIYGTNDGMLHFVNGVTGAEEWRYLPSEFWSLQQVQYLNAQGDHTYGLDVTPTIWLVDNNGNGKIEPASPNLDTVKAFIATRRGGNYIYALDLTANVTATNTPVIPKFLWKIQSGTGNYTRLGQTWSQPQLTTISISNGSGGTTTKEVLIFGGGYDTTLDDPDVYEPADNGGNDFMGNAIYITDPSDGSLIISISGADAVVNTPSAANIPVADMHYSIPSRVRLMDSDGDGDTDRIYVGDTGGQIWRVDLDPMLAVGDPAATVVGKLADVSTAAAATQRRFFEPPSVVQVRDTVYSDTMEYDYVLIGSGYRAHPLNSDVDDRFYAFRDRFIGTFSLSDADAYPQASGAYGDIDLIDVTSSILNSANARHLASDGWYYDFTSSGEKSLSAPTTINGVVVFTTFKLDSGSITNTSITDDPCQPTFTGSGASAYNIDILSANAGLDWNGDGDIDLADRSLALGSGIPSDVVPIFTEEGVIGIVGIQGGASQLGVLAKLPRFRTYWYEEL